MSLVTQKFQEGGETPEVRLYKRGNDQVNLDDFVRLAEAGFNNWLNNVDIKDKHKKEVRAAYQDLITKINDDPESFTARLGGGFTNTAGITNASKGFDAYGVAAGYLGNTLRSMSVYTKPEVKSDKKKYGRNSGLITSAMLEQMWGNSPDSFIKLDDDSFDETTGKRSLKHRTAQTITGLLTLKGSLRDYYDFDSDEDYNHAIARIDSAIASLLNGNPNDDWFTLSQLGMTNLDRYFSTGVDKRTTPYTPEELLVMGLLGQVRDFEDWMSSNRPFYIGLLDRISIGELDGNASSSEVNALVNKLSSLRNDDLKNWIFDYIENPTYDMTHHPTMLQIFGGAVRYGAYTPSQIMRGVLALAIYNGLGKKASDTLYYFPDTLEQHSDRSSTVYAYNLETQSLDLMDTQDIAEYRQQYFNEYRTARPRSSYAGNSQYSSRYPQMYASHKLGGILKALNGVVTPTLTQIQPPELPDISPFGYRSLEMQDFYNTILHPSWTRLNYGTNPEDLDEQGNARVWGHDDLLPGWEGAGHSLRTDNIGTEPLTPSVYKAYQMQRNYINSGNMLQDVRTAYQNWLLTNPKGSYLDFVNFYNDKVLNVRDLSNTKFTKGYGDTGFEPLYNDYNWLYSSSAATYDPEHGLLGSEDGSNLNLVLGSTMFNRNALTFNSDDDSAKLRLGSFIDDDPTGMQFWINNEGKLELRTSEPANGTNPQDGGDGGDEDEYNLDEILAQLKALSVKNDLAKTGFWGEVGTDLLGAGRLAGSIWANNRIAKTVRESLRPKLHNTYELYSPVTGAFSEMQLRNRQGADTLSQSYRPFTSDASLAAARMLEGQRSANDLQYQGFIADDNEIKRTQAEALKRLEDNIARRSALANENRDAILAHNLTVAQLEADRIKSNWNSIDKYLYGVEDRMRRRITDTRDRRNNFALQTGQSEADTWKEMQIASLRDQYRKWANGDTSKTFSDWVTLNQDSYTTAMKRINAVTAALKYRNYADVYGLKYNWPTMKVNGNDVLLDFNITTLPWLKHGGPLKPTASYLIDKIIRQNNK